MSETKTGKQVHAYPAAHLKDLSVANEIEDEYHFHFNTAKPTDERTDTEQIIMFIAS